MKKNEARAEFRVLGGRKACQGRAETGGHDDRPTATASGATKLEQTLRVVLRAQRTVRPLALAETDPIRSKDTVRSREVRVDFGPFIRRRPGKKVVQENQRIPLPADVVNDLSARGALHAARENRWRNDIGERGLGQRTSAQAQGHHGGAEQTCAQSHAQTFFPERRHDVCQVSARGAFDNAPVACRRWRRRAGCRPS